jgi:hypothetical protein
MGYNSHYQRPVKYFLMFAVWRAWGNEPPARSLHISTVNHHHFCCPFAMLETICRQDRPGCAVRHCTDLSIACSHIGPPSQLQIDDNTNRYLNVTRDGKPQFQLGTHLNWLSIHLNMGTENLFRSQKAELNKLSK